nr:hypothetical protein [Nonomuraea cypriaca]
MDATPIRTSVMIRTFFLPIRSPKCPKNAPPRGRTRKPTANVANELIVPVVLSNCGKNSSANTTEDAMENR